MNVTPRRERGTCETCGTRPQRTNGFRWGNQTWKVDCGPCHRKKYDKRKYRSRDRYRSFKKGQCEKCGFVAEHPCQLDVDHVDGNRQNRDPSNFQTLCANCHRLKTQVNFEFRPMAKRPAPGR